MARRVNNPSSETATPADLSDSPPMPGGAPGVIENATSVLSEPGKPTATVPMALRPELADLPQPKRYRVERGGKVMYGGCGIEIRAGKLIEEHHYDVDLLRRQGIVLKEV